jgi:glycosyltransferase involved in cell wall biosynthesis
MDGDGYGYAGLKILQALGRVAPGEWEGVDLCIEGKQGEVGARRWVVEGPAVVMSLPQWWRDVEAERRVGFTMFEATRMPEGWVELINAGAEACLVPSEWLQESFVEQGVRILVHVAPLGVDPMDWYFLDRSDHKGPYTFLWCGTPDARKGWEISYLAFRAAFGDSADARLIMHMRKLPRGIVGVNDPNVEFSVGMLSRGEMRGLMGEADCFVFPSRGEGWGLPPREAAATGLPTIATDWGGTAVEIEHWGLALRVGRMTPAAYGHWDAGTIGEWAEPDFEHLVELMRWCEGNREEAARRGEQAAAWLATAPSWERTARKIIEVVG